MVNDYIVQTKSGRIRGYKRKEMIEYRGIPFAEPPTGPLRFKRARAIQPWTGILDAKEYGDCAVQEEEGRGCGSEDCLTLNIQCPLTDGQFPVFVWIHGGGYNIGAASDALYDGQAFTAAGIIFVSIQYRLNVLGFYDFTTYPGCEDFDSNCGVSDQIMALNWIYDNIAAFGGNPEKITIAGESAGGSSVINMLAAPAVKGKFSQAIAQSPLPNCICTHETARDNINLFLEGMGWTEADLPKLRTIDPYQLLKGNTYMADHHQEENPGMFLPGPVLDDLIPVRPIDAIRDGSASGVKLIIGTNRHEGTMFVRPENTNFPNSWEMVQLMLLKNGYEDALPAFQNYYSQMGEDAFIEFATDYAFQMPSVKAAMGQRKYNDVWMYRYEYISNSGLESGWRASHAFEIPCVFLNKTFEFSQFVYGNDPEAEVDLLFRQIHNAWVQFIKNGHPDVKNWPCFDEKNDYRIRIFDKQTRTEPLNRQEMMKVWGDLRFYEK